MSLEQITESFLSEAAELVDDLEAGLLTLEDDPSPARIDAVFRALHTLKGSGSMFGFVELSGFVHHFETAFEEVRAGRRGVDPRIVGAALAACDIVRALIELPPGSEAARDRAGDSLAMEVLQKLNAADAALAGGQPSAAQPGDSAPAPEAGEAAMAQLGHDTGSSAPQTRWRIRYQPAANDLRNGARPDLLVEELLALGEGTVRMDASRVPDLAALDPTEASLGWIVDVSGAMSREDIDDVFVFADDAEIAVERVDAPSPETESPDLPESTRVTETARPPAPASAPEDRPPARERSSAAMAKAETLKVPATRVDQMMETLGELVIAQSRLMQGATRHRDPALEGAIEEVERLVLTLREAALSMRMLPVETVFGKFRRVVRDLSDSLGKEVELQTRGGETEVDKNVLDRLTDPLVHMLRNSLDHGLEAPEARLAAGKPRTGTVRLSARQDGGSIVLEIADDGRGLNTDAIRRRAIDKGLISAEDGLTDQQVMALIFAAGFSTAETVSDVSGRGVGMDAVCQTVDALGGTVDVASKPGQGTRISLTLPVSLAIVEGLRVKVGKDVCVLPLASVDECVDMPPDGTERASGRSSITVRGELLPVVDLEAVMGWHRDRDTGRQRRLVIVRSGGQRIALGVDDILGQAQTVVKPLSPFHSGCKGLAGATILGDGSVALILDVPGAISAAYDLRRAAR
jgi:two-component system chemotaxis sensor kinase CheA